MQDTIFGTLRMTNSISPLNETPPFFHSTTCPDCIAGFVGVDWLSRQGYNASVVMVPLRPR
jgi:hypothetical protein